jgi:phage baseplate assembly protein W
MAQISYPYQIDGRGRTASATDDDHIRQMIEQVLFTDPGERVNRPDFGAGVRQLLFAPGTDEMAAAAEFLIRGALQQWLGDLIQVETVQVRAPAAESSLQILIQYVRQRDQQRRVIQLSH